jgi:hypothetical protein
MATTVRMHEEGRKPTPIPIQIQRGASQPATRVGPSFLTTLPSEIRNEVYKWLFERNEPIIYDGCRSEYERLHMRDNFVHPALSYEELMISQKPSHDLGPGISLLRSCRQVYFKVVGILHGANSFLVSANLFQHNIQMTQFRTAAEFLTSLGSQLDLLREFVIDITPLCPGDCLRNSVGDGLIDILPIVRILWTWPGVASRVSLTSTGRNLDRSVHPFFHEDELVHSVQLLLLWDVIRTMGCHSVLNIMKHGRFERLVYNVWVNRDLDRGWATYPPPPNEPRPWAKAKTIPIFDIISRSQPSSLELRWIMRPNDSMLHQFPENIKSHILKWAIKSKDVVMFDLDRQTVEGLDFSLMHSVSTFRYTAQVYLSNFSQVSISFATSEARTDFSDYISLQRWVRNPIRHVYTQNVFDRPSSSPSARIVLIFNTTHDVGLASIRVNVTTFLALTYSLTAQSLVLFRIKTETGKIEEHTITLETIRKGCFDLLTEMLRNDSAQSDKMCPELWIDCYGTVVEAIDSPAQSISRERLCIKAIYSTTRSEKCFSFLVDIFRELGPARRAGSSYLS